MNNPPFITFEGGEGGGKTTQIRMLADFLEKKNIQVRTTREPGGTPAAEAMRALLVEERGFDLSPMSEALLLFAARDDHVNKVIKPALKHGKWVLCDRFADSTYAYQGYGLGLGHDTVSRLYDLSIGNFKPDVTFIMDIDPQEGVERSLSRADNGETKYESLNLDFHKKLRSSFLDIAAKEPDRCIVIDATGRIDEVHERIISGLRDKGLLDE